MEVDADKKERCAVGVEVANKSAVIYISADVCNGGEGCGNIRGIVHG